MNATINDGIAIVTHKQRMNHHIISYHITSYHSNTQSFSPPKSIG
jgi:hypothetical protein